MMKEKVKENKKRKTMINFVLIKEVRILKSAIKRYEAQGETKLLIFYKASKVVRAEYESFTFPTSKERDEMLHLLDNLL